MRRILVFAAGLLLTSSTLVADQYEAEAAKLADLMHWRAGEVIAEIGAGEGQMSFFAALRVRNSGHIYITELDDSKLAYLRDEVRKRKLENVTVIKADPIGTNLPNACCQAIFMRRVYHHFTEPAQTNLAILRALQPGGLLAVIDFAPRSGLPPVEGAPRGHGGHGIPKNVLVQELKSAGFELVSEPQDWPEHDDYCVIARKPLIPVARH